MGNELDYKFHAMGSEIRMLIGERMLPNMPTPLEAADRERAFVWSFSDRLSRFIPGSELTALNHDRRATVPASKLLRAAVTAALWAAERSNGLVDPTLVQALERNGYDASLDGDEPASLPTALARAPTRAAARPDPSAHWRSVVVDNDAGTITRRPGVMIDTGGIGKGLCADAVALRLGGYSRLAVDCGGDIAIGGIGARLDPYKIEVEHPLSGRSIGHIEVAGGGIATSGLNVRIWRHPDGTFAHHLLDPSTGAPVWSGLVGATALGASALEAETLSKMALLLGASGARRVLAEHGGVIVHDSGAVDVIGRVPGRIAGRAAHELSAV